MAGGKLKWPHPSRSVFLAGFMAAGKTTVGRILAEKLNAGFVDLDEVIAAREGRSIRQIFHNWGEAAFRKSETAALNEVLSSATRNVLRIVALGGGALGTPENLDLIRDTGGLVIFLDAPVEELFRRCRPQGEIGGRPLAADEEAFRRLYEQRRPQYLFAGLRVETQCKSPQQSAAEIESWLKQQWRQNSRGRTSEKK